MHLGGGENTDPDSLVISNSSVGSGLYICVEVLIVADCWQTGSVVIIVCLCPSSSSCLTELLA